MGAKLAGVIMVLLLLATGAVGGYAYRLDRQVDDLKAQLQDVVLGQEKTLATVDAIGDEVEVLADEMQAGLEDVRARVDEQAEAVSALGQELPRVVARLSGLEQQVADVAATTEDLVRREPGVRVEDVYEAASHTVVQVSDGTSVAGAGFVYDDAGHIVTAYHVIEGMTDVYIVLADGRISPATVVGSSPRSDVAVLQAGTALGVPAAVLADSSRLKIGQAAAIVGSPFGQGGTVTAGVVSQLNQVEEIGDGTTSRSIANLIQFDAAANPGNSGGPMFDEYGRVIGLVVARVQPEIGSGVSWAVSSNKVKRVADAIIATGRFDYPWLGVEVTDQTPRQAEAAGRDSVSGALVVRVVPGGPAQVAGMREGDLIIRADGQLMASVDALVSYLGEYGTAGEVMTLTVIRDSAQIELGVTLGTF